MRIKATISYIGTRFHGYQRQENSPLTVQAVFEDALFSLTGERIAVCASGRTDEGVHALSQVLHFDTTKDIPPEKYVSGLNHFLPDDISVLDAAAVGDNFDARRSAKRKTYCYSMYVSRVPKPIIDTYAARLDNAPDVEKMRQAAQLLVGTHDFNAFHAKGSSAKTTERTIYSSVVTKSEFAGSEIIRFTITGNGFLYKMVRILAGSLIKIGDGRLSVKEFKSLLDSGAEWNKKLTAPARGLMLVLVEY